MIYDIHIWTLSIGQSQFRSHCLLVDWLNLVNLILRPDHPQICQSSPKMSFSTFHYQSDNGKPDPAHKRTYANTMPIDDNKNNSKHLWVSQQCGKIFASSCECAFDLYPLFPYKVTLLQLFLRFNLQLIKVKYRYVWARSCDKRSESKLNHTHAQISVPSEIAHSADQLFVIKTLPGNQWWLPTDSKSPSLLFV